MKLAIFALVALGLLSVAGAGIAPTVCVNFSAGASALASFVSDPQPDSILAPDGVVDQSLVCP